MWNDYIDSDVNVRDNCRIAVKYRGFTYRDCNINVKWNHKIPVVFHNLMSLSFSINKKLSFIDSFQFLSSSLDSLVKNLGKDDFNHSSQEFDNNVWDLVKQKGFYSYEYMTNFKMFKSNYQAKKRFMVC